MAVPQLSSYLVTQNQLACLIIFCECDDSWLDGGTCVHVEEVTCTQIAFRTSVVCWEVMIDVIELVLEGL